MFNHLRIFLIFSLFITFYQFEINGTFHFCGSESPCIKINNINLLEKVDYCTNDLECLFKTQNEIRMGFLSIENLTIKDTSELISCNSTNETKTIITESKKYLIKRNYNEILITEEFFKFNNTPFNHSEIVDKILSTSDPNPIVVIMFGVVESLILILHFLKKYLIMKRISNV